MELGDVKSDLVRNLNEEKKMTREFIQLTDQDIKFVSGGSRIENNESVRTYNGNNLQYGTNGNVVDMDLFYTGVVFTMLGAAALATAPFVAIGTVGAIGLAASGGVLGTGGGILINTAH